MNVIPFKALLPLCVGELDRNEQRQVLSCEGALVAVFTHECLESRVPEMEEAAIEVARRVNAYDDMLAALRRVAEVAHFPEVIAAIAKAEGRS